jgi:hypothetical protein
MPYRFPKLQACFLTPSLNTGKIFIKKKKKKKAAPAGTTGFLNYWVAQVQPNV